MIILNERSIKNLIGVHSDLVKVVLKCAEITSTQFIVTCGLRTLAEQQLLLKQKRTTTLRSRHLNGHAVDLAVVYDGKVTWDFHHYLAISRQMKEAAHEMNVAIEWGGDWSKFIDGPHFQLPWDMYP